MKRQQKVTIVYKSGVKVRLRLKRLSVTWGRESGTVTALEWEGLKNAPIHAGLGNIESVWNGWI